MLIPRNIRVDHYYHHDLGGGVIEKLDAVLKALERLPPNLSETLNRIETKMTQFTDELQEMADAIAANTDATTNNTTVINALMDQAEDLAGDEVKLREFIATVRANTATIVAAGQPRVVPPPVIIEPPPVGEETTPDVA